MRNAGWQRATEERVKRIWQQEGLRCLRKNPLKDGFVFVRDAYGRKIRMLTMIDEFTRICLVIRTGLTNLNTPISEFSAILIGPMGQKVESKHGKTTKTYPLTQVKSQSGASSCVFQPSVSAHSSNMTGHSK